MSLRWTPRLGERSCTEDEVGLESSSRELSCSSYPRGVSGRGISAGSRFGPKKAPGVEVPSTSWIALVKKEDVGGPSVGEGTADAFVEGGASMIRVNVAVSMIAELRKLFVSPRSLSG
ncbi:hypothetical protein KCU70_g424, partial [Aureobasidium melanogenum]